MKSEARTRKEWEDKALDRDRTAVLAFNPEGKFPMRPKSFPALRVKETVKAQPLAKFAKVPSMLKKNGMSAKNFRALVLTDKNNVPQYFVFDAASLWNMFCSFDETYEKIASPLAYSTRNPFGWLIDAIEERFPLNPKFVAKLKKSIRSAEKLGVISLSQMLRHLRAA